MRREGYNPEDLKEFMSGWIQEYNLESARRLLDILSKENLERLQILLDQKLEEFQ